MATESKFNTHSTPLDADMRDCTDIHLGCAHVPATLRGDAWALPGGVLIRNRDEAQQAALALSDRIATARQTIARRRLPGGAS